MTSTLILGAGLAGSSVAWHLARGGRSCVVLEREHAPATHASSQNAAMVRSLVFEPAIQQFALEGARFWAALPETLSLAGAFRRVGSLLLASEESTFAALRACANAARAAGLATEIWSPEQCRERLPVLDATPILGAAWSPMDGVADPVGLVTGFLDDPAISLRRSCEVEALLVTRGRVHGVRLATGEELLADRVVVAAGAWTGPLLRAAGADDRGLRPMRRHLFCTADTARGVDIDTPFVWHLDHDAYFRWEGGAVLFSACDEDEVAPSRPGVAAEIDSFATDKLARVFPFLLDLPVSRRWAGLRTFATDRNFVLGRDARVAGLFHAAGLGGHGVTCAPAIGRAVARAIDHAPAEQRADV